MRRRALPRVSVIIATNRSTSLLDCTLRSLSTMDARGIDWELVMVPNGPQASECIEHIDKYRRALPIRVFPHETASRSAALNLGMEKALGPLLVFTDDDVIPSNGWLQEINLCASLYKDAILFCGPIIPRYPPGTPDWLPMHPLRVAAFAHFDAGIERGYLPTQYVPFGPNFAVRRECTQGLAYRLDLGPSCDNGPLAMDDTEFVLEVRRRYSPFRRGGGFIYSPAAGVQHQVRPEQLESSWLYTRFFNFGRSAVRRDHLGSYRRMPSLLLDKVLPSSDSGRLELAAELNFYLGQLCELRHVDEDRADILGQQLRRLGIYKYINLACQPGRVVLEQLFLQKGGLLALLSSQLAGTTTK
jgi:glycosyltransferase involved in cell wall biosynthesis